MTEIQMCKCVLINLCFIRRLSLVVMEVSLEPTSSNKNGKNIFENL